MALQLVANGAVVVAEKAINGTSKLLRIMVENLRQAPTGVHGRVSIIWGTEKLAWDTFNVERSEDRTRLAKAAHKMAAGEFKDHYSADFLKLDLADFCEHCWDCFICQHLAQDVVGDPALAKPVFLLDPYIVKGGGTIMFGPPKSGKSYVQLAMALCIQEGIDHLWPVTQAPVLLVNLERSEDSVRGRLAQVAKALGQKPNLSLPILTRRGWSLAALEQSIAKSIANRGIQVVLLDSLSRGGFGDMIGADKINPGMDTLNRLSPTWHALAHSPRADASHVYGGVFWDAAADLMVRQSGSEESGKLGVALTVTASNHSAKSKASIYAFIFQDDALADIRSAAPGEFPELEAEQHGGMLAQMVEFLKETNGSTATIIAKELGFARQKVAHRLAQTPKLFVKLGGRSMKGQMYGLCSNRLGDNGDTG